MIKQIYHLIFKLLTHPRLERFRVWIPYPLYVSLVTFVFAIPLAILMTMLKALPLSAAVLLPLIGAGMVGGITGLCAFGGIVSGYRPYRILWTVHNKDKGLVLSKKLMEAALECGFDIVWQGPQSDFVGVLGIELEGREAIHEGYEAPARVSFRLTGPTSRQCATLKVEGRTVVLWDTGEGAHMKSLGSDIARKADIDKLAGIT